MSEKRNFKILISLIIILSFALIAIGYLAYKNYKLNEKLDSFIEYTNNLLTANDSVAASDNLLVEREVSSNNDKKKSESQSKTVKPVKVNDTNSNNSFILSSPIKSDYHIGKTYGFYKNSKTNELELHEGIDFDTGKSGTPVYSVIDGQVTEVGFNNEFGNYVTITDSKRHFKTRYCNLSTFRVKRGQLVSASQIIGNVGNTGKSDGPHLGFYMYDENGNAINPTEFFSDLPEPTIPPVKNK